MIYNTYINLSKIYTSRYVVGPQSKNSYFQKLVLWLGFPEKWFVSTQTDKCIQQIIRQYLAILD